MRGFLLYTGISKALRKGHHAPASNARLCTRPVGTLLLEEPLHPRPKLTPTSRSSPQAGEALLRLWGPSHLHMGHVGARGWAQERRWTAVSCEFVVHFC